MTPLGVHPQRLDIALRPGDPIDFSVPVLDAAGSVDITGWTPAATATTPDNTFSYTLATVIAGNKVRVSAAGSVTHTWAWPAYAARLVVTAAPPTAAPVEIVVGWIRLYLP